MNRVDSQVGASRDHHATERESCSLAGHLGDVPTNDLSMSTSEGNVATKWTLKLTCLRTVRMRDLAGISIVCIRTDPKGKYLAVLSLDSSVRVIRKDTFSVVYHFGGVICVGANACMKCSFSHDGRCLPFLRVHPPQRPLLTSLRVCHVSSSTYLQPSDSSCVLLCLVVNRDPSEHACICILEALSVCPSPRLVANQDLSEHICIPHCFPVCTSTRGLDCLKSTKQLHPDKQSRQPTQN